MTAIGAEPCLANGVRCIGAEPHNEDQSIPILLIRMPAQDTHKRPCVQTLNGFKGALNDPTWALCKMMVLTGQETQVNKPALGVSPLLHHSGRNVALRHAVRLWHFTPHALLGFLQVSGLAPSMSWTSVWSFRSHTWPVSGPIRSDASIWPVNECASHPHQRPRALEERALSCLNGRFQL